MMFIEILYNQIVGEVSAYWEDGELKQWLEEMFDLFNYLPHVGFTTWSGNVGMQIIGDKIGMQKEGVIRKVRYWENQYYDSIKYGILKDEI